MGAETEETFDVSSDSRLHYRSKSLPGRLMGLGLLAVTLSTEGASIVLRSSPGPPGPALVDEILVLCLVVFLAWYVVFFTAEGPVEVRVSPSNVTFWSRRGRLVHTLRKQSHRRIRLMECRRATDRSLARLLPDARYFVSFSVRRRIALSEEAFRRLRDCFEEWSSTSWVHLLALAGGGSEHIHEYS